ncbi:MAG: metallophosphoesterase [bacterium]
MTLGTLGTLRLSATASARSRPWSVGLALLLSLALCGCESSAGTAPDPDGSSDADGGGDADGAACADTCPTEGAQECHEGGIRACERIEQNGCLAWSAPVACAPAFVCDPQTVSCVEACGEHCDPFSIVLLPDTQYYTSKQANGAGNTYRRQMQWIVDHRQTDNILFVAHLGDITNNNTTAQWETASDAHALLDAAGIPYSVVPGNHDYLVGGAFDRGGSLMNDYFAPSRFAGNAWYGGSYGTSNTNSYAYFANGEQRFLVINLEYSPRKDVLCWASDLVASHPDHHVIIATHCYLTHGGVYSGGCPNDDYDTVGASGADVWNELVAQHSNIFLVVSGHIGDSEVRVQTTHTGSLVHEMLVDYQFEGECGASDVSQCTNHCRTGMYHGNGWMRQLTFDPRQATITARTFTVEEGNTQMFPAGQPAFFCSELFDPPSPSTGGSWYASDPSSVEHQLTFSHDFVAPPRTGVDTLGETAFTDRTVNRAGAGDQLAPAVAMAPGGDFVVAWQDDSDASDGAGNHDIFVRGFLAGGCQAFADLRVNPDGAGHQANPAVAMDAAGNFAVVWEDDADGNGVYQLKARGFAANGSELFAVLTVNSAAAGQQRSPTIAMAPGGEFVVAWQDDPAQDGNAQILMRGFHADGTERFADRSVHDDNVGARIAPAVGLDALANIVVAWQDDSDGNGSYQIHGRGFHADGSDRFARITVNSVSTGQQRDPAVAVADDGRFVVVWRDDPDSDGDAQIRARGFHADGSERFADFGVSSASGQHLGPVVTCGPQGEFAVTWADDTDGNGAFQIYAGLYAADGTSAQPEWTVNREPTGQQLHPGAALNGAGALVIAWEDDMDGNGVYQLLARGY